MAANARGRVTRGETRGTGSGKPMTHPCEDMPIALTKEIIDDVANDEEIENLTEEHYRLAHEFFDSYCEGPYTWRTAIADGLRQAEDELREKKH